MHNRRFRRNSNKYLESGPGTPNKGWNCPLISLRRRKLPLVLRFHHRMRSGAIQPCKGIGIAAQVGVPKGRGKCQNDTMMIGVSRFVVTRKCVVGEYGMLGIEQHDLIFWRALKGGDRTFSRDSAVLVADRRYDPLLPVMSIHGIFT